MKCISFLSIFILMIAFSFVVLPTSVHALSLNDIISSIASVFTGQPQTSGTQGSIGGMPNPASVYCVDKGGKSVIVDCRFVGNESEGWYNHLTNERIILGKCGQEGSQTGFCFLDDNFCEEWNFYKSGICNSSISCTNDLDCPENMKCTSACSCPVGAVCPPCQPGHCIDVGCVPEGGYIPGAISPDYRKHMATECCQGLSVIEPSQRFDQNCNRVPIAGEPSGVCSKCGNGICEPWETKCNCPQDCGGTTTTTTTVPPSKCIYGTVNQSTSIQYSNYYISAISGSDNNWADILITVLKVPNPVQYQAIINQGESKDFSDLGITIKVFSVRASQDGTVSGAYISVGPIGMICNIKPPCPYQCCNQDDPNYQYKPCEGRDVCNRPCPWPGACLPCPCQNHQCVNQNSGHDIVVTNYNAPSLVNENQNFNVRGTVMNLGNYSESVSVSFGVCNQNIIPLTHTSSGVTTVSTSISPISGGVGGGGQGSSQGGGGATPISGNVTPTTITSTLGGGNAIRCYGEGEGVPLVPNAPSCCPGLILIKPKDSNLVGTQGICTKQGGGGICQAEAYPVFQLAPGETKDVSATFSLPAGYYQLSLAASIPYDQNPSNNQQTSFLIVQQTMPSYTINYNAGWNMFSVPVNNIIAVSSTTCSPASPIYGYSNGNYYQTTYTTGGNGYWVKMNSDCSETLTGTGVTINDFPTLNQGWNLIGAPSISTIFSDISGNCNVVAGPFWYNPSTNSYIQSSTLDPSKGYFVKVSANCQLGAGLPPSPPQ